MKRFRYLEDAPTLCYNAALCAGCGNCVTVCPHAVFAVVDKRAVILDRDGCMECGACALNCPEEALYVRAGVGCAQAILYSWLSRIPLLRKVFSPDSCCT